jgi:hypothetical protein
MPELSVALGNWSSYCCREMRERERERDRLDNIGKFGVL